MQPEPSEAPPPPDTYRCLLGKGGKHGIGSLSDSLHDGQEKLNPRPFPLKFNTSPTWYLLTCSYLKKKFKAFHLFEFEFLCCLMTPGLSEHIWCHTWHLYSHQQYLLEQIALDFPWFFISFEKWMLCLIFYFYACFIWGKKVMQFKRKDQTWHKAFLLQLSFKCC